jgi:hypothetical protein
VVVRIPRIRSAQFACALCLSVAALSSAQGASTYIINTNGMIACPTIEGAHLVAQAKEASGQGDLNAQAGFIGRARAKNCNKIDPSDAKTVDVTGIDPSAGVLRLAVTVGERGIELFAPIHAFNDNPVWYGELPRNIDGDEPPSQPTP